VTNVTSVFETTLRELYLSLSLVFTSFYPQAFACNLQDGRCVRNPLFTALLSDSR